MQKMIPNLLITNLENSRLFHVLTWERMTDLLKQMGKKDVAFIDNDLGYALCRMEGIAYVVSGSLAKSGETFVSDIKIFDAESKELKEAIQKKGRGEESILETQINELSQGICEALGVTLEEIDEGRLNIGGVTSSSPEAYQHYLNGNDYGWTGQLKEAKAAFENAIEIDPSFASAYRKLATVCTHLRDFKTRREVIAKAMELSSLGTEKERLYIESQIAGYKGDNEKRISILEEIIEKYPKEKEAHFWLGTYISLSAPPHMKKDYNRGIREFETALELDQNFVWAYIHLGNLYAELRNFEKSLECQKKAASLDPENAGPFDCISHVYFKLGKLAKSAENCQKAIKINRDAYSTYLAIAYIEAVRENYTEALDWIDSLFERSPPPSFQIQALRFRGFLNLWLGRFEQSLLDLKKMEEVGANVSLNDWDRAVICFAKGGYGESRDYMEKFSEWAAKSYLANYGKIYGPFFSGLIDLKQGNLVSAKARLGEMKSVFQTNAIQEMWQSNPIAKDWHNYFFNILDCEIGIFERKPDIDRILKDFGEDRIFLT